MNSKYNEKMLEKKVKQNDQLNQELNDLKFAIQVPNLYLSNHFLNLKKEIDEAFVKKLSQEINAKLKDQLKVNWIQMIDLVTQFESECIAKAKLDDRLVNELDSRIEIIEFEINNKNDFEIISDLLYEVKFLFEKNCVN